jgi:Hypervirulence associated proteins TUDOR domain
MAIIAFEFVSGTVRERNGSMAATFKIGDHVSWNSEAGRAAGRILRVHTKDVNYKGYVHHASENDPQYEIKSDKTDHIALHKGAALKRLLR